MMNLQLVKHPNSRDLKRACATIRSATVNGGDVALIVAYSRARRLNEVSLEYGPEAFLGDRLLEHDLSRGNRCAGDFLDLSADVYLVSRMGRAFDSSKPPAI